METIFMAKARGLWCLPSWPPVGWPTRFLGPFWDVLGRQREKNRGETKWVRRWSFGEPWGFRFIVLTRGKLRGLEALTDTQQSVSILSNWSRPILKELASFSYPCFLVNIKAKPSKNEVSHTLPKKKEKRFWECPNVWVQAMVNPLYISKVSLFSDASLTSETPVFTGPPRSCRNVSGGRNAPWSARRGKFFVVFGAETWAFTGGSFDWGGNFTCWTKWWFSKGERILSSWIEMFVGRSELYFWPRGTGGKGENNI